MHPLHRPPSVAWEPVSIGGAGAWAWFFPPAAPLSIQFQVPPESVQALGPQLTVQALAMAIGVPLPMLRGWETQGSHHDLDAGAEALLAQPLAAPPGSPVVVNLTIRPPVQTTVPPAGFGVPGPPISEPVTAAATPAGAFDSLESNWFAIQTVERQLDAARQQLANLNGRLQSLNRDLNPEERRFADNADRKDWMEARRWLRDAANQVSRYIKEYDIGAVSGAGGRHRFEEIYKTYIEPRRPFEGLAAAQLEFEQYRKTHQSLLLQMQAAVTAAQRDGEQRAQQVLNRIAAKVRVARTKR